MHNLNLTLFYKTSFHVRPADPAPEITPSDDILWSIVLNLRKWIGGKWERRGVHIDQDLATWSHFKRGTASSRRSLTSANADSGPTGDVSLASAATSSDRTHPLWAASIEESFTEPGFATRKWVTEIGFTRDENAPEAGAGILSIALSYGDQPGYLAPEQDAPEPTIPGIVTRILRDRSLACEISGITLSSADGRYVPCMSARELAASDLDGFWRLVNDPTREVPVVLASPCTSVVQDGRTAAPLVDANAIAKTLGPSAIVFTSHDLAFDHEMRSNAPNPNLRCTGGTVRVYVEEPRPDNPYDHLRHRYFSPAQIKRIDQVRPNGFLRTLRRALAADADYWTRYLRLATVEEICKVDRIKEAKHAEAKRIMQEARQSILQTEEQANRRIADAEESLLEDAVKLQDNLDQANKELAEKDLEIHTLTQKCAAYEQAFASMGSAHQMLGDNDGSTTAPAIAPAEWPPSARQIASIFLTAYPDRLDFTKRGFKSLDECASGAKTVWNALNDLATIAYELYTRPGSTNIPKEFANRSRFELCLSSGMMTRKDNKLQAGYADTYNGRELMCESHLKSSTGKPDDPNFIRIYYAFDHQSEKIVISSCGKHLKNRTSSKLH